MGQNYSFFLTVNSTYACNSQKSSNKEALQETSEMPFSCKTILHFAKSPHTSTRSTPRSHSSTHMPCTSSYTLECKAHLY